MKQKTALNYAIFSALYGLVITLFFSLVIFQDNQMSLNLANLLLILEKNVLLIGAFMLPVFFCLIGFYIGKREDRYLSIYHKLNSEYVSLIQEIENLNQKRSGMKQELKAK